MFSGLSSIGAQVTWTSSPHHDSLTNRDAAAGIEQALEGSRTGRWQGLLLIRPQPLKHIGDSLSRLAGDAPSGGQPGCCLASSSTGALPIKLGGVRFAVRNEQAGSRQRILAAHTQRFQRARSSITCRSVSAQASVSALYRKTPASTT